MGLLTSRGLLFLFCSGHKLNPRRSRVEATFVIVGRYFYVVIREYNIIHVLL